MIALLVNFIVLMVVVGILYLIGTKIIEVLGLPSPAQLILQLLVLLIILIWVLYVVGRMWPGVFHM
jgi:hypothetical protein